MKRLNPAYKTAYKNRFQPFASLLIGVLAITAAVHGAAAAVDQREMKAREAFAVGQYQEALDLFAKLYAEKLHPNYLRNIGRCYQNLGQPDKAISSFHEYLRKAKAISPDERQEVEGYIKEMEDLKAKQQAAAATPPNPTGNAGGTATTGRPSTAGAAGAGAAGSASESSTTASGTPTATSSTGSTTVPTLDPTAASTVQQPAGADLTSGAQAGSGDDGRPIYGRWWFWAIVVGVIGAGVGVAAAAGAFTKTENATCPTGMGTRC